MKFLILGCYYERPRMVRFALESLNRLEYDDWECVFVDDGSKAKLEDVAQAVLSEKTKSKFRILRTEDTPEDKERMGGYRLGELWNQAMEESDADYAIMLCDDDALVPSYLKRLAVYYRTLGSDKPCSFCHCTMFDPSALNPEDPETIENLFSSSPPTWFRNFNHPVVPMGMIDASQFSWSLKAAKEIGAGFPPIRRESHDSIIMEGFYKAFGPVCFNGLVGQYKGWYSKALSFRLSQNPNIYDPNLVDI